MGGVSQEAYEELNRKALDYSNAIYESVIKLERAMLILTDLTNEYYWDYKPNLRKALLYAATLHNDHEQVDKDGERAWKYVHDYKRIMQFINIAIDYVFDTLNLMENVNGGANE